MGTGVTPGRIATGMGLSGLEPPTSRLSGVRSNRLSYNPIFLQSPFYGNRRAEKIVKVLDLNN